MTYFADYYRSVERIKAGDAREKLLKIAISRALLLYQAAFSLVVYVYQDRWSRLANFLAVNLIYVEHLEPVYCLWIVGFDLVACSPPADDSRGGPSYHLLREVLLEESLGERYFTTSTSCTVFLRKKKISIVKVAQLIAITTRNVMQLIIYGLNFHFLNMHFTLFWEEFARAKLFDEVEYGHWLYALFLLQSGLQLVATRRLLSTLFLVASNALPLFAILFILPRQLVTLVAKMGQQKNIFSTGHRLKGFFAKNTAYIRLLGDVSRLYGTATFRFFLVAYPQNAHLLMCLLLEEEEGVGGRQRSTTFKVGIATLLAQQLIIILLVHVFSARLATAVHRPVRLVNARLKMAAYLAHFNVVNRYGLTYGRVGAVTYASFGRSMVFYGKFLIYAYRLFA
ncbi:hypothetical protein TYRP_022753, partial [Tyrophagus putrescentiae]